MRRRTISSRTSHTQLSSLILINETPQASPGDHILSVLIDAVTHIVGNEEDVEKEDDILLLAFIHKLKKKIMTASASKDLTKGQLDDKA